MIPGPFEYHRPASVGEAVGLKSKLGDDARLLAGGHSLTPMMKLRLAAPEHLIDLQSIDDLKQITISGGVITIGCMATQTALINSEELFKACPILRETSLQIADPQIRNMGTLGGNVANGDPGNDMPAVMKMLDATYLVQNQSGNREISARNFYEAAYFTQLEEDEMLTAVRFNEPAAGHGYSYMKQKRKVGDYATAAAAVTLSMSGGNCTAASIGLTNVADTPLFAEAAAAALVNTSVDQQSIDAAVTAAQSIVEPAEDGRGPVDFRTHIAGVMVRRAIETALSRAS